LELYSQTLLGKDVSTPWHSPPRYTLARLGAEKFDASSQDEQYIPALGAFSRPQTIMVGRSFGKAPKAGMYCSSLEKTLEFLRTQPCKSVLWVDCATGWQTSFASRVCEYNSNGQSSSSSLFLQPLHCTIWLCRSRSV